MSVTKKLPESSQKEVDYHWPVVMHYALIQVAKELSNDEVMEIMRDYLANKTFLVRERKALMEKVEELLNDL